MSPQQMLGFYDQILKTQLGRAVIIVLGLIGVAIGAWLWPRFFEYRYAYITPDFWQSVFRFWPIFLWGSSATAFLLFKNGFASSSLDGDIFRRGLISSVGAGVTEEAWYRGVGVFYAMISLVVMNWIIGVAGWVFVGLGGIGIVLGVLSLVSEDVRASGGLITIPIGVAFVAALIYGVVIFNHDIVYQVYEKLFYPVIDFVTFGLLKSILYGEHPPLLVMGMFLANFWFRDGHRYQGLLGWTNSWFLGCVFIFATLTYGLAVAIVVHTLYNAFNSCTRYLVKKTGRRAGTGFGEVA